MSELETHFNCLSGFHLSKAFYANVVVQQKKERKMLTILASNLIWKALNWTIPIQLLSVLMCWEYQLSTSCSCWLTWWIPALSLSGLITAGSDLNLHLVMLYWGDQNESDQTSPGHYHYDIYDTEILPGSLHCSDCLGAAALLSLLPEVLSVDVGQIFQQDWPPVVQSLVWPGRGGEGRVPASWAVTAQISLSAAQHHTVSGRSLMPPSPWYLLSTQWNYLVLTQFECQEIPAI